MMEDVRQEEWSATWRSVSCTGGNVPSRASGPPHHLAAARLLVSRYLGARDDHVRNMTGDGIHIARKI